MNKDTEQYEIRSKIESWCHQCFNKISKGDQIIWFPKGKRAVHKVCPSRKTHGTRNSGTSFGRARFVTGR